MALRNPDGNQPTGVRPKPMMKLRQREFYAIQARVDVKDICVMDGQVIKLMCFKGDNVCSEICRKDRDGDHAPDRALSP